MTTSQKPKLSKSGQKMKPKKKIVIRTPKGQEFSFREILDRSRLRAIANEVRCTMSAAKQVLDAHETLESSRNSYHLETDQDAEQEL